MANWKDWVALGKEFVVGVTRATLIDFNRETRQLWLSQLAL